MAPPKMNLPPGAELVDDGATSEGMKLPPGATLEKPAAAPPTPDPPGFFQRVGEAVGVPTSMAEVKALPGKIARGAVDPAGGDVEYLANIYTQGRKNVGELKEAVANLRAGQPVGPNIGSAALAGTEFALRGPLGPFGGETLMKGGEDVEQGNLPGFAGDLLGSLVNYFSLRAGTAPSAETAANKLAYAAGGEASAIQHALPDLKATAEVVGQPKTVGDFLKVVNASKDRMNLESGSAMLPIAGRKTVPIAISDAIKSRITPNLAKTPHGQAQARALQNAALDFERPWTFAELDAERTAANARLRAYHQKGGAAQYSELKTDPSSMVDKAVADSVRDIVYPAMDRAAGKPPGYFAALKQRQGSLIELEDHLNTHIERLRDATAQSLGGPVLSAEAGTATTAHGITRQLARALRKPNPMRAANVRVAAGFATGSRPARAAVLSLPARYLTLLSEPPSPPQTAGEARQRVSALRETLGAR